MARFNGFPSWTAWNVSLWINNDEGLYRMAQQHIRYSRSRRQAALSMLRDLLEMGVDTTPDGAKFSMSSIMGAMRGL